MLTLNSLQQFGIGHFFHSTPMHYLPFIARDGHLRSKQSLLDSGFDKTHFRRTSNRQDLVRGFGDRIHSTLMDWPPILCAKLARGFPHVRLAIPTSLLSAEFDLCRFNIAKGRYLRSGSSSLPENDRNGKYYEHLEIPVARFVAEQTALLEAAQRDPAVIEVLAKSRLKLSSEVECQVFSKADYKVAEQILNKTNSDMKLRLVDDEGKYLNQNSFTVEIVEFVDRALKDPDWKGNGLDYDKL